MVKENVRCLYASKELKVLIKSMLDVIKSKNK